jgi:hypothetical protein
MNIKEYALVLVQSKNIDNYMCFCTLNGDTTCLENYKTPKLHLVKELKKKLENETGGQYIIIEVQEVF